MHDVRDSPARREATPGRPFSRTASASLAAAALLAAAAAPLGAQASGPPLAPDHWAYELVEALDVAGVASSWAYDVRPVGREALRGELERALRHGFGGSELVEAWLERLDRELPLGAAGGDGLPEGRGGSGLELRAGAGVRDGDAFLDPGAGAYGALAAAAAPGGGVTAWAAGVAGGRERFDGLRAAGLSRDVGPFAVSVGRQRLKAAGPASTSSQLSSAVPLDALHVASREPVPVPGLERLAGPVSLQLALAPWADVSEPGRGWIGVAGIAGEPHPRLRIGATRSAVFARRPNEPFTGDRLLRTLLFVENRPSSWDDHKAEAWARLRWELFGQPLASWAVLGQEDGPFYLSPGVILGTRAARLARSGLWTFSWEYRGYGPRRARWCVVCERVLLTGLTESGRSQGPWYVHQPDDLPYARQRVPLGDDTGGHGAQHRLELSHFSAGAAFRGRLWAFFQVRDDERNLLYDRWPGKRRGVGLEGAWRAAPSLELGAAAVLAAGPEFGRESGLGLRGRWTWGGGEPAGRDPADGRRATRAGGSAAAADRPGAEPGERVRIRTPALVHRRAEGRLRSLRGDTLHVAGADGAVVARVHRGDVERLEVQRGTADARWWGALLGTVAGFGGGVIFDEETRDDHLATRPALRVGATAGGAALGWLVGRLVPVRRWVEVAPGRGR